MTVETDPDTPSLKLSIFSTRCSLTTTRSRLHLIHDCREGICGMCSLYINGHPHGPCYWCYHLPALHAPFRRWRDNHCRALALCRVPVIKDLMVEPQCFRPDSAGRRLCVVQLRRRTGCQQSPHLQGQRRHGYGLCYMHRLRRMCGCL